VGNAALTALRTPGHTDESTSCLLDGQALFTGDTLFLAGVGRPDLEATAEGARRRARLLFDSLQKLVAFPPDTMILPGHTSEPVPFDGRPIAATLGEVWNRTEMLRLPDADFVDAILSRIPPTPPNHTRIVAYNQAGELPTTGDLTDLEAGANRCAVS
jgi:glyoxylase-like metal-dependent hydrolase (beta-lactamase superfamily II)